MSSCDMNQHFDRFGNPYQIVTLKAVCEVPPGETSTVFDSPFPISGTVKRITIKPGQSLTSGASIRAYERDTVLSSTSYDYILNYTVPTTPEEIVIYPKKTACDITGTPITSDGTNPVYVDFTVNGHIRISIENASAGDSVIIVFDVQK